MHIVFFVGHDGFIRNFETVLRGLDARGHTVHLALSTRRPVYMSAAPSLAALVEELGGLTWSVAPDGRDHDLAALETALTGLRDHLRFLAPEFAHAPALRARAAQFVPAGVARAAELALGGRPRALRAVDCLLRRLERVLPGSPGVQRLLAEQRPDAVLVTPLVGLGARQAAALRTAHRAGLPTALLVHSWDNLTNQGVLHELPDRVLVWNAAQREEAVRLHGVPAASVAVTGAHSYDEWFERLPQRTREAFLDGMGLDPTRALVLYVGSSSFIAPDEPAFVRRWLAALRAHPATAEAAVLLRPHPQNRDGWEALEGFEPGRTAVWPGLTDAPSGEHARAEYFDAMHHASAIVGINTSALVESAIQSRPVLSVLDPAFRHAQEETLHFAHLRDGPDGDDGGGGVLLTAADLPAHLRQLAHALADPASAGPRSRAFLARFVRPYGLDEPAAPRVVAAVEALGLDAPARREPAWHAPIRVALRPSARLLARTQTQARARRAA